MISNEPIFNKGKSTLATMNSKEEQVFSRKEKNTTNENTITKKDNCFICLEDIDKKCASFLPCSHSFHGECIDGWLKTKNSCPVCRTRINDNMPENIFDSSEDFSRTAEPYFVPLPYFNPYIYPTEPPYFIPPFNPLEPYIIPNYSLRRHRFPMIYYPRMFSDISHRSPSIPRMFPDIIHRWSPLETEFSDE